MHLLENIKEAFRSIHSNLLRTVLTALIVSIGIMSLVGILTAIDAIKYSLNETFASLGANSFEIKAKGYTNRMRRGGVQGKVYPAISYLEATQYKRQVGDQAQVGVSAFISQATEIKGSNGLKTNPNMNVVAGDENYLQIQSYNLAGGRVFSPAELENGEADLDRVLPLLEEARVAYAACRERLEAVRAVLAGTWAEEDEEGEADDVEDEGDED